jgi:hypothetical protein
MDGEIKAESVMPVLLTMQLTRCWINAKAVRRAVAKANGRDSEVGKVLSWQPGG